MFFKKAAFAIGLIGLLSGCAHTHRVEGPEVKSEIPEGIRVQIGSPEVKEGDRVSVMRSVCKQRTMGEKGSRRACTKDKIGEAKVVKVLDHDAAIVQPDAGLRIESGMSVESLAD